MKKKANVLLVLVFMILSVSATYAAVSFSTGIDSMNYSITTWSIRTDYAGTWLNQTPNYFKFNSPGWATRYTNEAGAVTYTQAMSGAAVNTDVFSQADLQAVATSGPGWSTMSGSSAISFWNHGGQFLKASGGNNSSWADDTYWASNEYGYINPNRSTVVTDFTGTFTWDGIGNNYIEGKILADDWAKVYINGSLVHTTDTCAYDAVETFSASGLLINGVNNIKVTVYDTGQGSSPTAGPTALQLEITPEPATICLLGLGALGLLRRKNS